MRLSLKSWRPPDAPDAAARAEMKLRIERIFGLREDDVVAVNEIACFDPTCSDAATVIVIMRPGEPTQAVTSPRPMAEMTDVDIECLASAWRRQTAPTMQAVLPGRP